MAVFRITPDDLADMQQIARVTSYTTESLRWTELGVYHRPGENRPFVVVTEGHSIVPGEKLRFQFAAMGTLDRAMNWFEGSTLRDELAEKVDAWQAGIDQSVTAFRTGKVSIADEQELLSGRRSLADHEQRDQAPRATFTSFTAALTWLYPRDDLSERALAIAFERDFGMPERTVRNTLAIEAGRVEGKVGPWVQPMLVALRFMDRKAWEAANA